MAALKKNKVVELFWRIHPRLYRWTGGRIGHATMNMPVLLLTTKGRRSGRPRTRALMYMPDGDSFVVIASYLGEPRHPAWWRVSPLITVVNDWVRLSRWSQRLSIAAAGAAASRLRFSSN